MRSTPRHVDLLTYLFAAVFAYGTAIHVVQLLGGGGDPYPGVPAAVAWFFLALVVLDPFAAILIIRRRRIGLVFGATILILDAAANGVVNYPPHDPTDGMTAGRVGQAVVTALAVLLVCTTPRLRRWYR
ncbi:MAG: hypothetical protein QME72_20260 [Rhodococcus sp. (in: high G+C Gram-positive bacteria)]|nr:hypothetical protein [Rhodococcus sp. (in: high G+C Gram-positive bacteria)]MDI6630057.1 hypothetical protein [Rhodococcus sp. (in: high G+C Gram-positive bacteria)]